MLITLQWWSSRSSMAVAVTEDFDGAASSRKFCVETLGGLPLMPGKHERDRPIEVMDCRSLANHMESHPFPKAFEKAIYEG